MIFNDIIDQIKELNQVVFNSLIKFIVKNAEICGTYSECLQIFKFWLHMITL